MDHAAPSSGSSNAAQQAAFKRFGLALLVSAACVSAIALFVYRVSPPAPFETGSTSQKSGVAVYEGETVAPAGLRYDNLVAAFTDALQRDDDASLRAVYPTITDRELRILHSVRRRMGASTLSVDVLHLLSATPEHVQVEFEILANRTHLPFVASIGKRNGEWLIEELH